MEINKNNYIIYNSNGINIISDNINKNIIKNKKIYKNIDIKIDNKIKNITDDELIQKLYSAHC